MTFSLSLRMILLLDLPVVSLRRESVAGTSLIVKMGGLGIRPCAEGGGRGFSSCSDGVSSGSPF